MSPVIGGMTDIVATRGAEICVQTFGDPADAVVLLIMGSSASMDWWEDEFCERLAAGGRFVIRYDHRDTGRSTTYEPGEPGYGIRELVDDAVDLLDHFGLDSAHIVGMSLGGGLAQIIAVEHPERVASLTLIATAPAPPGPQDPDLPAMTEETIAEFSAVGPPDWAEREAVIDYLLHLARASAARSVPFDEEPFRALAARVVDRSLNVRSSYTNHARLEDVGRLRERLGDLRVRTLVVHGAEDPVVPHGNGEILAREIPGARLVTLEATGHEIPRRTWDVVVPAVLGNTAGA